MALPPTIGTFPGGIVIQVLERGPAGQIDPADRARFDRAAALGDTLDSEMALTQEARAAAEAAAQTAQLAARTAAEDAATNAVAAVVPAAADGIRNEVKAHADLVAAAAAAFSLGTVKQNDDGTWPARPAAGVVHWLGWDNPGTTRMLPGDLWFSPETRPEAPGEIASTAWQIFNAMDGMRAILRIGASPPLTGPAVLRYEYRLTYTAPDGSQFVGNPVAIPAAVGDVILSALTNGRTYAVEIRAVNVIGSGPWSAMKAVTVSDEPFSDDFNRTPGQKLSGTGQWRDVVSSTNHGMIIGTGGIAVPGANSRLEIALANAWMPDDQYAEAIITGAQDNDWRNPRGGQLLVRTVDYVTGYSLQFSPTGCSVRKKPNGGSGAPVTGLSYDFPAGLVYPMKARLQAVGSTLSIFINDALVAQVDDTTWTSGAAGMMVYRTTGSWGFDNFKAGPAA